MRAVAFCLLEHKGRILLQEFWHEHEHYYFYRPLGGGIEQGELAADAMRRELREELDTEVDALELLTVLENIFEYGGETKHEIVFLFKAQVPEGPLTEAPELQILDNTFAFRAVWKPLEQLSDSDTGFVLYPVALRERMAEFISETYAS
ncbi:MAG: NUDIX domain-containing protein [Saprospiraceae bacterium]|nr:NUDIX domain-containing protein [Saprospiraceae bacterium]